ncbi:glycoside hydrolase family 13 protein [Clostridium saccharoperbutylacetonicum]|uniref:glycoside hydrolase family 13 protein n=1 Tax=Clostridium saccharoperbutylacetonicum TaxID=36745 RepID=UPI000983D72A|nr:glycoside hydrolase family 13 protein [Clostridium saccharoperbutylacetonicum]AQR97982.1 amylopullulanase precursor [Clostridium saccharoperbutylacetonicum]NSB33875.1 glycosidase [Clostridium saccharoperbutylacetonicum]
MDGIQVIHDSQSIKFRRPFGAVEVGQKVKIAINVDKEIVVAIELIQFDGTRLNMGMQKEYLNNGEFRYSVEIDTSDALGLLEYYFILIDGYDRLYYGNNDEHLGGVGQIYNHNPVPYQITVYEKSHIPDWYKEGVIYQILLDRFYNGNDDKTINSPKENSFIYGRWDDSPMYIKDNFGRIVRWDFYGGNLKGVIKKLDYIKTLGANIIQLSPVFKSPSCHKYDTANYEIVDEMFGTNDDFKELCEVANSKGIKIILDIVLGYTSSDSKYFNRLGNYDEVGAYNSPNSRYYGWYKFIRYPYQYESWWGINERPSIDSMQEGYIDYIARNNDSIIKKWINLGASGWKLNVIDELSDKFIEFIRNEMDEFGGDTVLIGDIWEDASNKVSYSKKRSYLNGKEVQAATNYPIRESLINFIKGYIKSDKFKKKFMSLYENYPIESFFGNVNIVSTNDTERILTVLDNSIALLRLLVVIQFTLPGVPLIYYGDETGIKGGKEPDNRKSYPWGKEDKNLIDFYSKLIGIRNNEESLKKGDITFFKTDEDVLAFERNYENEKILVLVNVSKEIKLIKSVDFNGVYINLFDGSEKYKFSGEDSIVTVFQNNFKILKKCNYRDK